MSEKIVPKCPKEGCGSTNFVSVIDEYVSGGSGHTHEFIVCKKCHTAIGVATHPSVVETLEALHKHFNLSS